MAKSKKKKVPLRTCIACKKVRPKKELVRIVRLPSGEVRFDPTGKLSGRGTYLCLSESCMALLDGKKLSYALEVSLLEEDMKEIKKQIKVCLKEQEANHESS